MVGEKNGRKTGIAWCIAAKSVQVKSKERQMKTAIWWIRNDQRLADQPLLAEASKFDRLIPVYIDDPVASAVTPFGFKRRSERRTHWLMDSLAMLDRELRKLGSHLTFKRADTTDTLLNLVQKFNVISILAQRDYGEEERRQEEVLQSKTGGILHLYEGQTLIHPDDLPFELNMLPEVFTQFRKGVERDLNIRALTEKPTSLPPNPEEPFSFNEEGVLEFSFAAGEEAARSRVNYYFEETQKVLTYKETRNGLLGIDYSTRFSLWLANGNLSARQVYFSLRNFEQTFEANESTYWVLFELLWRDYFKFVWLKHGKKLFLSKGIKETGPVTPKLNRQQSELFERWTSGATGNAFADACMKELSSTGFLSNRGRQNAASFLCHDLKTHWLAGAWWFESQLLDFDPCSNYGNWQYIAGIGNDPRVGRKFNLQKQAEQYDSGANYRNKWLKS